MARRSAPRLPRAAGQGQHRLQTAAPHAGGWCGSGQPSARGAARPGRDPTKTPEFLAAGLPVVSTSVLDVVRDWGEAGLVDIADGPAAFADALGRALDRPRAEWLRAVDRRLSEISWDRTWGEMKLRMSDARRVGAASSARASGAAPIAMQGRTQNV